MTPGLRERCAVGLGPRVAGLATAAVIAGAAASVGAVFLGLGAAALGVLAATWLFTAGLAAGGVAFSAAVHCSRGRWAAAALPAAEASAAFFPAALALLAVLVLGAREWIPGAAAAGWGSWLSRCVREEGATALLFVVGSRYLRRSDAEAEPGPTRLAITYLLLYAAVVSLWAIDLVMDLHDWAPSTVIPPFVFIGAFLGAIALGTVAAARGAESGSLARGDLGKLLLAMAIFWGYLVWAAYLPVWYGNLPDETGQLLALWAGGWKLLTLGVLVTVLGFPFFFLLPERSKRGRTSLTVVAASILVGLLGERFLLVLPSLDLTNNLSTLLVGGGVAVGVLGLFLLTFGARLAPESRPHASR